MNKLERLERNIYVCEASSFTTELSRMIRGISKHPELNKTELELVKSVLL